MRAIDFFFGPFFSLYRNWPLVQRMVRREIEGRVKSTFLGWLWIVLGPLLNLSVYEFVFSYIFKSRWPNMDNSPVGPAVMIFCGLTLFYLFSECVSRAPSIVLENVSYVKKVIFPLDCLVWILMITALINLLINFAIILIVQCVVSGGLPLTSLLLPFIVLPLILFVVGVCWLLSALGVYLRDIRQFINFFVPLVMFLAPVLYPVEQAPALLRGMLYLNPLTVTVQEARDAVIWGRVPDGLEFATALFLGLLTAASGFWAFGKMRKGFGDVL